MPRSVEIKGTSWECPECKSKNDVVYDSCAECDIEVELIPTKELNVTLKQSFLRHCEKCIAQYVCGIDVFPNSKKCRQTMRAFDLKGLNKSGDNLDELCDTEGNLKKNPDTVVQVIADMDTVEKQCWDQQLEVMGMRIGKWTKILRILIGKEEK